MENGKGQSEGVAEGDGRADEARARQDGELSTAEDGGCVRDGGACAGKGGVQAPAGLAALRPHVKVMLTNPSSRSTSAFGQGVAELCVGVRDTGSLNAAAKAMGMAYSKAWRVLRDTEDALGFSLLNRAGARGSTLTPEGTRLVDAYERLSALLEDEASRLLYEMLGE